MSDFSEAPPRRSWFGRNWGWLLGCGCLTPVLLCGGIGVGTYFYITNYVNTVKASDLYKETVAKAKADPSVKAQLGEPLTEPWWAVDVAEPNGAHTIGVTLTGPKGTGILAAKAVKNGARWDYKQFEVQIPNQSGGPPTTIDLLKEKDENKADGPGGGDMKK
jgi:hypothetical protein